MQKKLHKNLCREELAWFQRTKDRWLANGDRNIRFYHIKALQLRCRKKVHTVKDVNGTWLTDVVEIATASREFFHQLYTPDINTCDNFTTSYSFSALSEDSKCRLVDGLSVEEIKQTTFDMAVWKFPGPCSFPVGFFQNSWDIFRDVACRFIIQLLRHPVQIAEIPKVPQPKLISQFCPIALCNAVLFILDFGK